MHRILAVTIGALCVFVSSAALAASDTVDWKELNVSATAYNSVAWQTTAEKPAVAAWGDVLKPGMHAIAVSRDLIKQGLTYGTKVKIDGLPGVYVVRDKMNSRWKNKIDIYMGKDVAKARAWGIQKGIQIMVADNS